MQIVYTGVAGKRVIDKYVWTPGTAQDITAPGLLLDLLTYPTGGFEISAEDPLAIAFGKEAAAALAIAADGKVQPKDFKKLAADDISALETAAGLEPGVIVLLSGLTQKKGTAPAAASIEPGAEYNRA